MLPLLLVPPCPRFLAPRSLARHRHPAEPLRALRVSSMVLLPAVGALGGGVLFGIVTPNALLRWVGLAVHPTPDGVHTSCLEVIEALPFIAPHRLTMVVPQGVCSPAAQV